MGQSAEGGLSVSGNQHVSSQIAGVFAEFNSCPQHRGRMISWVSVSRGGSVRMVSQIPEGGAVREWASQSVVINMYAVRN